MRTTTIILSVITSLFYNIAFAQEQVTIEKTQMTTESGIIPAYKVYIPQTIQSKVIKEWGRMVISETVRKGRKKPAVTKAEYSIDSVFIKHIAEEPLNLRSSFMQKNNGVEIVTAFNHNGQYIDSTNILMDERVLLYIRKFAITQYLEAVNDELKSEERKLEKLNEQLDQLVKQNTRYKKNISTYNNDTIDLKQEIIMQTKLKEVKNEEILQQERNVSRSKSDPVMFKEQKKRLSEFKHEKKQISNKIKRNDREIVSKVSNIERSRRLILLNDQEQEKQKSDIENQMALIEQIKLKLERIE